MTLGKQSNSAPTKSRVEHNLWKYYWYRMATIL